MRQSLRISVLLLLLVIPQHGNSPLPDMESWLKKDQDDGSVQHDFTSALTGRDESFGSAHQTYQNSLIREKKSQDSELPSQNKKIASNRIKRHGAYHFGPPNQKLQNLESMNPRLKNKFFRENKYFEVIPSQNLLPGNRMNNFLEKQNQELEKEMEVNPRIFNRKRLKQRHASDPFLYYPQLLDYGSFNYPLQEDYLTEDDRRGREISDEEYKNQLGSDGKSSQLIEENDYYDGDLSPALGEDDINGDDEYNQYMGGRAYVRKKNEAKQAFPANAKAALNALDYANQNGKVRNYAGGQDRASVRIRDANRNARGNHNWKADEDPHLDDLQDLMKDSQKALQEVEVFQKKLSYKPSDLSDEFSGASKRQNRNPFIKCEKRNYIFDGSRLKREDEDEQKNMKTGTDEGGGEYEDEEGKGHKDEEEYYEDADFSESKKRDGSDVMDQKFVKREITQDANLKRGKDETNEESEDYKLNLENAPVEHADKSRKSSYREGEKTNKFCTRKGVKIWDQWGKWSPCSVTCGVGRSTRWRHCIGGGCAQGEKEAQIKRCTNPAC